MSPMIVITMAGLSKRFKDAGYKVPKYMLEAHGATLFEHSVNSFNRYFNSSHFVFAVRDELSSVDFVNKQATQLGIKNFTTISIEKPTRGQAETLHLAIEQHTPLHNSAFVVFNIDTFRPDFLFPNQIDLWDGYLEVFRGPGEHWSFALPESNDSTRVARTAEKERISDLCSTGLYYFRSGKLFNQYYLPYAKQLATKELYIAPLYNALIKENLEVHFDLIDANDVFFCGIPDEYNEFLNLDPVPTWTKVQ